MGGSIFPEIRVIMGNPHQFLRSPEWERVQAELAKADDARSVGNEGMARVCARRAVGIAAGVYLENHQVSPFSPSAYDRIKLLCEITSLSERARRAAESLLLRVTPEHDLPIPVDLVAEARWLSDYLIGEGSDSGTTKPG
jgi:hypothetical protein